MDDLQLAKIIQHIIAALQNVGNDLGVEGNLQEASAVRGQIANLAVVHDELNERVYKASLAESSAS